MSRLGSTVITPRLIMYKLNISKDLDANAGSLMKIEKAD